MAIDWTLQVPAGTTEGQLNALISLITSNTTGVFAGTPYLRYGFDSLRCGTVRCAAV